MPNLTRDLGTPYTTPGTNNKAFDLDFYGKKGKDDDTHIL